MEPWGVHGERSEKKPESGAWVSPWGTQASYPPFLGLLFPYLCQRRLDSIITDSHSYHLWNSPNWRANGFAVSCVCSNRSVGDARSHSGWIWGVRRLSGTVLWSISDVCQGHRTGGWINECSISHKEGDRAYFAHWGGPGIWHSLTADTPCKYFARGWAGWMKIKSPCCHFLLLSHPLQTSKWLYWWVFFLYGKSTKVISFDPWEEAFILSVTSVMPTVFPGGSPIGCRCLHFMMGLGGEN